MLVLFDHNMRVENGVKGILRDDVLKPDGAPGSFRQCWLVWAVTFLSV